MTSEKTLDSIYLPEIICPTLPTFSAAQTILFILAQPMI